MDAGIDPAKIVQFPTNDDERPEPPPRPDAEKRGGNGRGGGAKAKAKPSTDTEAPWIASCQSGRDGPRGNHFNAMVALRSDPRLRDLFAFDEFERAPMLMCPLAGSRQPTFTKPRPITDADVDEVLELIQGAGIPTMGLRVMTRAIVSRAWERRYHPVRDYLDALKWDGFDRLGDWLKTYFDAGDELIRGSAILSTEELAAVQAYDAYLRQIGTMFLISMVARIYQPGCKVDYMLVIEGDQGPGKSRAARIMGRGWFKDSMPDIGSKDASIHINGAWLIEQGEMAAMSKADANTLKSFISRTDENYRPPYGMFEVKHPRQCCFVGTTNKRMYLIDETGARRFLPFWANFIDLEGLERDMDQLYAQAVVEYRKGTPWWPEASFEREVMRPQQRERYVSDVWEDAIAAVLEGKDRVTVIEIAQALGIDTAKLGTSEQRRITTALTLLDWKRGQRTTTGRWWVPNAKDDA